MNRPVFYYSLAAQAPVGSEVVLDGPEGHHAASVRRLRQGEHVVLTDGRGTALDVDIAHVGRRNVTVTVQGSHVSEPEPLRTTVVQALPKGDRGELAVGLLTEVGVDAIVPWQAERSVSRWHADKVERGRAKWQAAATAAAKQSRRVWWPVVEAPIETADVAKLVIAVDAALVLHEGAAISLVSQLESDAAPRAGRVAIVVGPEGGITDDELHLLEGAGGVAVRLGPTVLRTSTAGVVAASLVLSRTAGWRSRLDP